MGKVAKRPSKLPPAAMVGKNLFCSRAHLTNEASVEKLFIDRMLANLGFHDEDVDVKTSIKELKVGAGSGSSLYKPDYIIRAHGFPAIVVDAKAPDEDIEDWVKQCRSYCLELNAMFEHNPVEFYILSNGLYTNLYSWDKGAPLLEMTFSDFVVGNPKFGDLRSRISKPAIKANATKKHDELKDSDFELQPVSLDKISSVFLKLHDYMREKEKKTPSAAFMELLKVVFVKIRKDRELREKIGTAVPKFRDMRFSVAWIEEQTESTNPINDLMFRNLREELQAEIIAKHKHRIFDDNEEIELSPTTVRKVVEDLEHFDFYSMDEDIHGRMFENFLDATVRGPALGQFFTPRDVVKLMVRLADIEVTKTGAESVLDACCGSGGFLIAAMADMLAKAKAKVGLSLKERGDLEKHIRNQALVGIDAGSDPSIYRIARMNMYLHGDGGANIYFADALDKGVGMVGKTNHELEDELKRLRKMLLKDGRKFDVILSNPPFSLVYAPDSPEHRQILNQYELSQIKESLLSSVMFLERYKDLVAPGGRILAVIDDSILSGESYAAVREYIRGTFIIVGIVSLPGDAFRRADARVKTSILILRPK